MSITAQEKPEELVQFNVRLPRRMVERLANQAYYHRLPQKQVVVAALDVHLAKLERAESSGRPAPKSK